MILFIDPSINHVGYAIFNNNKNILYGCFNNKFEDFEDKLKSIYDFIESLIIKYNIEKAIVEKPASFAYGKISSKYGKIINLSAMLKLSYAFGCIISCLKNNNIKIEYLPAEKWKGRINKKQVKAITNIKNEHTADAYLMGLIYLNIIKLENIKSLKGA
jgi:Holliday junction resolvasome RuvABC endonuclease subunit